METSAEPSWVSLKDEEMLALRICDLGVRLEGSELEPRVNQLFEDLAARGVTLRPDCYLGDEWFSPEGVPAIAIPFYLAHPRLKTLEMHLMMEVEGGTPEWCQMLLRHECGHAVNHAYRLSARQDWQERVWKSGDRVHAGNLHAASLQQELRAAPAELVCAGSPGRGFFGNLRGLAGQPAGRLAKEVPRVEVAGEARVHPHGDAGGRRHKPLVTRGRRISEARKLRKTLARYYAGRRKLYAEDFPDFYDADLRAIFSNGEPGGESAAKVMRKHRAALIASIVQWTGQRKYTVSMLVRQLIQRCQELKLLAPRDPVRLQFELAAYLATLVTNHLYTGRFKRSV